MSQWADPPRETSHFKGSGPMRAVVYLRVSTEEQSLSGAGLNAQHDSCAAHCGRLGWEMAGPHSDEDVGGAVGLEKRPALLDAIAAMGAGDVLLIAKRDRLGRDPIVIAMIEAAIARKGGRIVSAAGEGTEDDSPSSILMRRMVDAFAEYERLIIKARTRAALAAKRRRGERTGSVPFGSDLGPDGVRLVANPSEILVRLEMERLRDAGLSPRKIAAELDRLGIATKKGKGRWSHSAVRSILASPPRSYPAE
jgi:DNA invertase Pin-like site-specific DNA recombinase